MKGNKKVIDTLNKLLTAELTAADQYFAHSRMFQNWGYHRLYERVAHERAEELEHADRAGLRNSDRTLSGFPA